MGQKRFNAIRQQYTNQQSVAVADQCNAWAARNIGDDLVFVNGIPLQPPPGPGLSGESFSVTGNADEIFVGRIDISFEGVNTNPAVEIVQQYYIQ